MSLTDTDKSGDTRANPTINAPDGLSTGAVKAHATTGIAYRSEDTRTAPRVIEKDDQIIIHDGVANKGLFGRDGAGNFVVKIAQDGFDVLTATDAQLIFNSANNIFKIVDTGTVSISHNHTGVNTAITTNIPHGQSGKPVVFAYANNLVAPGISGTPSYQMPFTYPALSGGNMVIGTMLYHYSTATNIVVTSWSANITTITADIKYYVLQETAN